MHMFDIMRPLCKFMFSSLVEQRWAKIEFCTNETKNKFYIYETIFRYIPLSGLLIGHGLLLETIR